MDQMYREPSERTGRRLLGLALSAMVIPAMIIGSGHATGPSFTAAIITGSGVTEPGIDVGTDGTIFVNAPTGLPGLSKLWKSTNSLGTNYSPVTFDNNTNRLPGGGDSDVVTRDGRVYFLDLWAGSNSLRRSDDNGATWALGTPFTTLPLSDRQWIALGKRHPVTGLDTVYVAYHFIDGGQLGFSRSNDGGLTWDFHTLPAGTQAALPGQLAANGDFLVFNFASGGREYVLTSTDAGATWKRTEVTLFQQTASSLAAVAMDGNNLYIAYVNSVEYSIQLARSTDLGATWTTQTMLPQTLSTGDTAGHTNMFPWVDARNGKVAVSWYGAPTHTGDSNVGSAKWYIYYSESLDNGVTFTEAVRASATAVQTNIICTNGVSCTTGRDLGDFQQVVIDAAGKSHIAYIGGGSLRVAKQT